MGASTHVRVPFVWGPLVRGPFVWGPFVLVRIEIQARTEVQVRTDVQVDICPGRTYVWVDICMGKELIVVLHYARLGLAVSNFKILDW